MLLKSGLCSLVFKKGKPITGPFFRQTNTGVSYPDAWKSNLKDEAEKIIDGKFTWFFKHTFQSALPPDWFFNPFSGKTAVKGNKHWTRTHEFQSEAGDIKIIWELSRFAWLTTLARAYKVFGDQKYLDTINILLESWSSANSANTGPNWKCGQETSFRIFKLFTVSCILNQQSDLSPGLKQMIEEHLSRIRPTITYAMAQRNNHATSEAAALYIGATLLIKQAGTRGKKKKRLLQLQKKGKSLLEQLILELVLPDGTFAQKSTNYHRVVIDTISVVLHLMDVYKLAPFKAEVTIRLQNLGEWQRAMIMGANGETPNVGNNDGAMIESMHDKAYTDFRPSTQQFFGLLNGTIPFDDSFDEPLYWRKSTCLRHRTKKEECLPSVYFFDNQYLLIKKQRFSLLMLLPDDTFRPGLDPFHIDLWINGKNVFIDSGTYSYNAGVDTEYFKSILSHNTISFNASEPMPVLSRFLNAAWLKARNINGPIRQNTGIHFSATYSDYNKNKHERELIVSEEKILVRDKVDYNGTAEAFFHFGEGELLSVNQEMKKVELQSCTLYFNGVNTFIKDVGFHSNYYLLKEKHDFLRVSLQSTLLETTVQL